MMSMASAQYQQQQQMQQQRQQQQIQQQQMQQQQQFQQHLYGMKQQGQVPTHGYHPGMAQSQSILAVPQSMATNILRPQPISTAPNQQAIHMGQQPINIGQHQPSHTGQQPLSATLGSHPMNITLGPQPISTSLGQQPSNLGQQQTSPNNPSNILLGSTIRAVPRTSQPK